MQYQKRLTYAVLVICLTLLTLNCGLTEMLQQPTMDEITIVPPTPTATPTTMALSAPTVSSGPTTTPKSQPTATQTSRPPEAPTPSPSSPAATHTQPPDPTPTDTIAPSPTETVPQLQIDSFEVHLEDTASGKTVHCTWETSGAVGVHIVVGTSQRFPQWREGPADGAMAFEVTNTVYDRPFVALTAFDVDGNEVTETHTLNWRCDHTYFFAGSGVDLPGICPAGAPVTHQGAHQLFQGGAMIWIPDIEARDIIIVIDNDNGWYIYDDTWDESQPENDPTLSPPANLYQPVRGFGKVWREHPEVQGRLGWAIAGEVSVPVTYQRQMQESIGGVRYVQVSGGPVMQLTGLGWSGSTWHTLP
jgi:hypothetical protein